MKDKVHTNRYRCRNQQAFSAAGAVVYWMQRDQRAHDNWALLYAQEQALERQQPLYVLFSVPETFGDAAWRQHVFMIQGLQEVVAELEAHNISCVVLAGDPVQNVLQWVEKQPVSLVVTDQNPLRFTDRWRSAVAQQLKVPLVEVDAHNIVPVWSASDKQEFAAHTFRPKIYRALSEYLVDFPKLKVHPYIITLNQRPIDWLNLQEQFADKTVVPVEWCVPGARAASEVLKSFIDNRGVGYAENRNNPNAYALSNLSPYLHFGHISAQYVVLMVQRSALPDEDKAAFLEELIVRRELTDNYCFYNSKYDKLAGAHEWAQKTLTEHRDDERSHVYTKKEFEAAQTHDALWNAMQTQLMVEGKMHGWCRMYWAKKILEWTNTPEYAIEVALYLNDKYSLDGTDPNGVVGVMWSIAGVHDRAWTERPVFGKIRYMNFNGAKRKFNVAEFIDRYEIRPDTLFA